MKYAHRRHLLAWAAASTLTVGMNTAANAQVMAQAKATITGLKISLIDLNTADGVTPSVTMVGSFGGFVDNQRELSLGQSSLVPGVRNASFEAPEASFTPLLSLKSQLSGGKVTVPTTPTGTALSLGATLSASSSADLKRATTVTEDLSYSVTDWRYDPSTGDYIQGVESFTGQQTTRSVTADAVVSLLGQANNLEASTSFLKVSANTLVVIEGVATLSATIDAQRVLDLQAADPALHNQFSGGANAQWLISLDNASVTFPSDPSQTASSMSSGSTRYNQSLGLGYDMSGIYANTGTNAEEGMALQDLNLPASGLLTLQDSRSFRVALANASAITSNMLLQMNLGTVSEHVSTSLSAPGAVFTPGVPAVPEVPTVPNIPEPGTWAQMGLGLIGLVAAVRRKRRAA